MRMLLEPGKTRLLTEKCDVFRDDFLRVETGFWLPVTDCITPPHPDLAGTPPPSSGWQYTAVRKADTSKNKREKGRGNALNTDRTTRFDFKKTEQLLKQREGNRTHTHAHFFHFFGYPPGAQQNGQYAMLEKVPSRVLCQIWW